MYRLMALQTVQVSVEPRLSTALKTASRAVVPKPKSLPVSATTFPKRCLCTSRRVLERLRKDIRPLFKLFSRAEPVPFEKEINVNLVYSSCLKHANEMLLGDPRHAGQRTQSVHFPRHSSITRPCCSSAQAPSSLSLQFTVYMHSSTPQAQNASTRRVYAPSR